MLGKDICYGEYYYLLYHRILFDSFDGFASVGYYL